MGEIIFFAVFTIPAIVGFAELIHIIKLRIISPKAYASKYLVVFLGDNSPYEQVVAAADELFWRGKSYAKDIIAVDCGIKQEEYGICRNFCEKNNFIFCDYNELQSHLDLLSGKL